MSGSREKQSPRHYHRMVERNVRDARHWRRKGRGHPRLWGLAIAVAIVAFIAALVYLGLAS